MNIFRKIIEYLYFHQKGNLALYDSLTGLYNYNWLNYIGLNKYRSKSVYVTMVDLDNFKTINDTYGHNYANAVLNEVADQLSCVKYIDKKSDVVRFGGDEFLLLTTMDFSKLLEEEGNQIISFGCHYKKEEESLTSAINVADTLMYKNKHKKKTKSKGGNS